MGPGSGEVKNQLSAVDLVDQQPVRRDVALPAPGVVPQQRVVLVSGGQRLASGQHFDGVRQQCHVKAPPICQLHIPLKP